ncbi:unnamed protein product [Amoebophrya sp. A120]|nr:unnamed protein product [Amoebophrya sp. A120]|eukprot:GSA120T00015907001.1
MATVLFHQFCVSSILFLYNCFTRPHLEFSTPVCPAQQADPNKMTLTLSRNRIKSVCIFQFSSLLLGFFTPTFANAAQIQKQKVTATAKATISHNQNSKHKVISVQDQKNEATEQAVREMTEKAYEKAAERARKHEFHTYESACAACRTTHPYTEKSCRYLPGVDKKKFQADICEAANCQENALQCPPATWAGMSMGGGATGGAAEAGAGGEPATTAPDAAAARAGALLAKEKK